MSSRLAVMLRSLALCVMLTAAAPLRAAQDEQYRERQVLDPARDEWVRTPILTGTPADDLERARSLLATNQPKDALKLLEAWTEANIAHERYYEGLFLLGDAYFETRDFYKAYVQYDTVSDNSSGELFYKSILRQMDVARAFLAGEKRIFWGFLRLPAYDDGIDILDRVYERVPGTRIGEEALKLKADYYYDDGQKDFAQDEYMHLAREYPSGRWIRFAMLRAAESAYEAFPGVRFDDRALLNAEERFRQFERAYPDLAQRAGIAQRLDAIHDQRAAKDLDIGRWYERTKQGGAAAFYYRAILKDYPTTAAARDAESRLRALGIEVEPPPAESPTGSRPVAPPQERPE